MSSLPGQTSAFPPVAWVRQRFPSIPAPDPAQVLEEQLPPLLQGVSAGARIAVAVGSRGIDQLQEIVRATMAILRRHRLQPFLIPAMGSHGGATAEGQKALLAGYGIREDQIGVPVVSSMEVQQVGTIPAGVPVFCSQDALQADQVLLINRVKPHTDFHGEIGSGLLKMLVVGLGKHQGARTFHRAAIRWGYIPVLQAMARVILEKLPLLGGVAIVEGPDHRLAHIEVVPAGAVEDREPELCRMAREWMPRLPFEEVDVLVVDRMGKNISGTGMDPAVIGRMIHGYSTLLSPDQPPPRVYRLVVCDLTEETRGNAIGLGMADFTTERLVSRIDRKATYTNAFTALSIQGAKIPMTFPSDREAIEAALETLPEGDPRQIRLVRIQDTLHLEWLQVSEALLAETRARGLEVVSKPAPWNFSSNGDLPPFTPPGAEESV